MLDHPVARGLPAAFMGTPGSSFVGFLEAQSPGLLPWHRPVRTPLQATDVAHGTTVLALLYADGVVMAGDRRGTTGNLISQHDMEKVGPADDYTAVAFAGTVAVALEMIRLFQVELEHYEKIEGLPLSLAAKANRLSSMVKANLGLAQQGMAMVPLLAGLDTANGTAHIFGMDVAGAVSEERDYAAVGSGSQFAKAAIKKLFRPGLSEQEAVRVCVEALYDAADEDTATGGPDLIRRIYPTIATVTAAGYRGYGSEESGAVAQAVVAARRTEPRGPRAVVPHS